MKIVAVDGFALNPGDLNWDKIKAFGEVEIHDRTLPEDIAERCKDAEIVLTNKVPFGAEAISNLPKLQLICVLATGYNIIDLEAARRQGVKVCNVPDYSSDSVAQHTFAFILELANQVGLHSASVHRGDWVKCKDFSYSLSPLFELKGKTLGLVGFGNIGRKVAEIGHAFGMKVLYHTPTKKESTIAAHASLETVFEEADFVSLHLPLKADNTQFVNKEMLGRMKREAFLINTARGALINEADLAEALNNEKIAGAALDVLSVEPPSEDNPLLSAKNCIISPHNAWMSFEARQRIMEITERNIRSFQNGALQNAVN